MDLEHEKRLTEVEARSKSNGKRIDKLEALTNDIHDLTLAIAEMAAELKHTNESVNSIKTKVDAIEDEPGQRWKSATNTILNTVLSTLAGAIVAALVFFMK